MLYSVLLLGLFFSSFVDLARFIPERDKMFLYKFWLIAFWLLKGLAWDTGPDFPQFYSTFEYADWSNIFSYHRYATKDELMEPGFVFLNALGNTFLPHYTIFKLITCGFIQHAFSKFILRFVPQYKISALAIMMVATEMFPVRQTIVTAIFCFALICIVERNFKKYLLLIFISFTIHKSSLLLLPLYFLYKFKFNAKLYIIVYLVFIGIRLFLQQNLIDFFNSNILSVITGGASEVYYITEKEIQDISIKTISASIAYLLLFGYVNSVNSKNRVFQVDALNLFSNFYFILLLCNVFGTLPGMFIVYRFANNFLIVYPILIVISCSILSNYFLLSSKLVALIVFFVSFFVKYSNNMIFDKEGIDYKTCFEPYYSVFDSDGENLIRNKKWPNYND